MKANIEYEIDKTITKKKKKAAFESDGNSPKLLKLSSVSITRPLAVLIIRCMENGLIPESLKVAQLFPIYKSGDQDDFRNYRPSSLLPVLDKVLIRGLQTTFLS